MALLSACYLPAVYCYPPRNPPTYLPAIHLLATSIPLCSIPPYPPAGSSPRFGPWGPAVVHPEGRKKVTNQDRRTGEIFSLAKKLGSGVLEKKPRGAKASGRG